MSAGPHEFVGSLILDLRTATAIKVLGLMGLNEVEEPPCASDVVLDRHPVPDGRL